MSFLAPLFLILGLLALPILLLYMLKLRRREVEISSTLLWRMLLRDREANAPWQKLKRNLLLLLQLLVLALLVLALARLFWPVPVVASGTVVVLLDASASMNATDVSPSRFEAGRAAARQLIEGLAAGGRLTLIQVGYQPGVLASASSDKEILRQALDRAQVSSGPADWEAALALASGAVRAGAVEDSSLVIISDGGLPENLPAVPGEVRYLPIGKTADNLALAAFALRPAAAGPQLFASLANYGDSARAVLVSFYVDGQLFSAQEVTVPAGQSTPLTLTDLPKAPAIYEARLAPPAQAAGQTAVDDFALDNTAWAVYQPPAAGRVLLISPGNVFLEQALAALPGLESYRLKPGAPLPNEAFDLYVYDGVISGTLPAADLLLVNPSTNALFAVGAAFTATTQVRVADDPLTRYVDWSNVHILQAHRVSLPAWARTLVECEGGPLVFAGPVEGRRVAAILFDLHASDLPLQVAYPILMTHLINYLAPAQAFSAPDGLHPGEALRLQPAGGDVGISITYPDGQSRLWSVSDRGEIVFADTHLLGVYSVFSNQAPLGAFAVNLFDPAESNIRPAAALHIGPSPVAPAARAEVGQFEIWPGLAAAAFGFLLLEWWVYQRGSTLPAAPGLKGLFRRKKV